jgi:hypothetical protein
MHVLLFFSVTKETAKQLSIKESRHYLRGKKRKKGLCGKRPNTLQACWAHKNRMHVGAHIHASPYMAMAHIQLETTGRESKGKFQVCSLRKIQNTRICRAGFR